jgi:hypothetical protein
MKSGLMLGVNPKAERQAEDFYATDPKALELFLERLNKDGIELAHDIWECACGQGHLAKVLDKRGHCVLSSDIVDRGFGDSPMDFLGDSPDEFEGDILTNPPFKLAEKFVERGMGVLKNNPELSLHPRRLYLFLKIQFLEGQKRKELFKKFPPKYVYCYSSRQLCCKDGEFEKYNATTQFYAWFVWEKGFKREPIIRWI